MKTLKKASVTPIYNDSPKSKQLDVFQTFLCNNSAEEDKLSNTIALWDSLPKYCISQQAQNSLRTKEGLLPRLDKTFIHKNNEYKIKITAAIIDSEDGGKAYYPSANEELVEDALRKIFADQNKGFFDKTNFECGVVFSLHLLRNELTKRGHSRSYYEITKSLNILSGSHIEINGDGKKIIKSNYISFLAAVSRKKLTEDPDAKWVVHFHPLVTQGVDTLSYRQYNYHLMMSHTTQLSRWLHKRFAQNYTNASCVTPYQILLSTIRRDSGLLEYKRTPDIIRKFEASLSELKTNSVILSFDRQDSKGERNKILDIKYSLSPHPDFIKEVKAANLRQKNALEQLSSSK